MKIPLKYNIGSLWVRRVGTLMTALGIGLTVAIYITMQALVSGLDATFVETGHPNHLIVIRDGSLNEVNSYFNRDLLGTIKLLPGIRQDESGEPRAAGELLVVINHPRVTGESSNFVVRGTTAMGLKTSARNEIGRRTMVWTRSPRSGRQPIYRAPLPRHEAWRHVPHVPQRLEGGGCV